MAGLLKHGQGHHPNLPPFPKYPKEPNPRRVALEPCVAAPGLAAGSPRLPVPVWVFWFSSSKLALNALAFPITACTTAGSSCQHLAGHGPACPPATPHPGHPIAAATFCNPRQTGSNLPGWVGSPPSKPCGESGSSPEAAGAEAGARCEKHQLKATKHRQSPGGSRAGRWEGLGNASAAFPRTVLITRCQQEGAVRFVIPSAAACPCPQGCALPPVAFPAPSPFPVLMQHPSPMGSGAGGEL